MSTASRIGRLGMLTVGLGIGAAVTALSGTASADPFDSNDFPNSVDGLGIGAAAVPAPASPTDIDISINGIDVFNGGGTATATSGMGDMAIAIGPHSFAVAEGGFGDYASAFSTGSVGAGAVAGTELSTDTGNNFDFASAFGNDSEANAGGFAGTTGHSFDFASAMGNVSVADGFGGSHDYASAVGDEVESLAGGSINGAPPADFDVASIWGNLFTPNPSEAIAGGGAFGLGGSNDVAFVVDPFGTIGSEATAGLGNNFDLAGALGDNLNAMATGADFLSHIAPFF